jgi:hypothetical protein
MTVRVDKLETQAPSFLTLAVLGILSTTTAFLMRWWQRPAKQIMSDTWLNDRARLDSRKGWE